MRSAAGLDSGAAVCFGVSTTHTVGRYFPSTSVRILHILHGACFFWPQKAALHMVQRFQGTPELYVLILMLPQRCCELPKICMTASMVLSAAHVHVPRPHARLNPLLPHPPPAPHARPHMQGRPTLGSCVPATYRAIRPVRVSAQQAHARARARHCRVTGAHLLPKQKLLGVVT